jgi:hypothetical protein
LEAQLGRLVKRFRRHDTWTKEKRDALEEIENYIHGQGYKVPENKIGYLAPYRGSWVRLMCIGQNSFYRLYLAGEVNGERGLFCLASILNSWFPGTRHGDTFGGERAVNLVVSKV